MVLHDNKWDRKAKQAYNRKHGIETPKPAKEILPKNHWKTDGEDLNNDVSVPEPTVESTTPSAFTDHLQAIELPSLPDMPEQSEEEKALIAQRIAELKATEQKQYRSHVTVVDNMAEFERINSNVEHSRMTRDMRRRFGKPKHGELEEDDDFESFMENPAPIQKQTAPKTVGKFEIDPEKQSFIDGLLR